MTIPRKSSTRSRLRPSIAVFVAALILVAQFVAVMHSHPPTQPATTVAAQTSLDTGLCALCQLALHSSLNPTSTPNIERLETGRALASIDSWHRFTLLDSVSAPTRAPPSVL